MKDFAFFISGALVVLFTSIISFRHSTIENKAKREKNVDNVMLFIVAIIGIIVSTAANISSYQDKIVSDLNRQKSDSIATVFQKQLKEKTDNLTDSLLKAKNKIIDLQTEINNNIIGGNGPCYILFGNSGVKNCEVIIINEGNLPIHYLEIIASNSVELSNCRTYITNDYVNFDEYCFDKNSQIIHYELLLPVAGQINDFKLSEGKDEGAFEIEFVLKNGTKYLEQIVFKKLGANVLCKGRLFKLKGKKYVFVKYVSNGVPELEVNFNQVFKLPLIQRRKQYIP